jgi:sigma-B regulation protein RsbU (phosphoserine phosphatase)
VADPMEAVRWLLNLRSRGRPEDLPSALMQVATFLDAVELTVLLSDYEQTGLWPLKGTTARTAVPAEIDGTAAGVAYCEARMVSEITGDGVCLWLPLLHGAERLGVMAVLSEKEPEDRTDLFTIAALVAELVASRRHYGDAVENTRRRFPMQLAAEIIWNQLPPLTFSANDTTVTAILEPSYDVGGDAFDYAANGDILHVAIFDTVGHGISASALTTLTLNTYRNARRSGLSLADTYRSADKWIRKQYPGQFVTAVLAELDTETGIYRRICAGHPAELLFRGGAAELLPGPTALPLGLGHMRGRGPGVGELVLEPGDTLAFYTDGVIESRSADGEQFGPDRLTAFLIGALGGGLPPAESLRRLIRTILSYENGDVRDDATAALLQWRPVTSGEGMDGR